MESIAQAVVPLLIGISILLFIFLGGRSRLSLAPLDDMPDWHRWASRAAGLLLLLGIWLLGHALAPSGATRIPSPQATAGTAWLMLTQGDLIYHAGISFGRVVVGFLIASVIGVPTGYIVGAFCVPRLAFLPINSFVRYIPPTAFVILLVVYFGIGEAYKYAVVVVGTLFFIVQMVVDAVEDIDVRYLEMGLMSGLSRGETFSHVILPAAAPRVLDVLRINLSAAWIFLVVAEMVGATGGLGHLITTSRRFLRIEEMFVAIVSFGVIGMMSDGALQLLSKRLFPWAFPGKGAGR